MINPTAYVPSGFSLALTYPAKLLYGTQPFFALSYLVADRGAPCSDGVDVSLFFGQIRPTRFANRSCGDGAKTKAVRLDCAGLDLLRCGLVCSVSLREAARRLAVINRYYKFLPERVRLTPSGGHYLMDCFCGSHQTQAACSQQKSSLDCVDGNGFPGASDRNSDLALL